MELHVPIGEDLAGVLDRVLGKSIVVESWASVSLQGIDLRVANARARLTSSAVYDSYGELGSWQEGRDLNDLFPFWQRDLWTK